MHQGGARRSAWLALFLSVVAGSAPAQERRDAIESIEREKNQARLEERLRQPSRFSGGPRFQWLEPVTGESPCFPIEQVRLVPASASESVEDFAWLVQNLGEYQGACLGVKGVDVLRRNLDGRLADRGYVTSTVSVAPQNLASGRLDFTLHVGRVATVQWVEADGKPVQSRRNAVLVEPGSALNLRDIEQTLENLGRLPSQSAQFRIEPAAAADHSHLIIQSQGGRPWTAGVGIEDTATSDFGRWVGRMQANVDAPLGMSDQLSATIEHSLVDPSGPNRQQSTTIFYSVPWGRHLFSLHTSRTEHNRGIQGTTVTFGESGYDQSSNARWQWTPWRSGSARASVWMSVSARRAKTFLEDVELVLQRRRSLDREGGVGLWVRDSLGDVSLELSHTKGRTVSTGTGLLDEMQVPPSRWEIRAGFTSGLGTGPLAGWTYDGRATAHRVTNPRNAGDLSSVGSRWTVRGFGDEQLLSGKSSLVIRQELVRPWATTKDRLAYQTFVAADIGHVAETGLPAEHSRTLAGAALGVRWQYQSVSGHVTCAWPLHKPANFESGKALVYAGMNIQY